MKVVHFGRFSRGGGAPLAAMGLHLAMRSLGADSHLFWAGEAADARCGESVDSLCVEREGGGCANESRYAALRSLDRESRRKLRKTVRFDRFSGLCPDSPSVRLSHLAATGADAIILHWLPESFDWAVFFDCRSVPVLWRLPDLFPLTGGCHYPNDCVAFREDAGCRDCPYGVSDALVQINFHYKRTALAADRGLPLTFVAQSEWMADCIRSSVIGGSAEVAVISNGVDADVFSKKDTRASRARLGFPEGSFVVLIAGGSMSLRKGVAPLLELLIGADRFPGGIVFALQGKWEHLELPESFVTLPHLGHDQMAWLYSACDLMVFPSRQDNCPNAVLEAAACGLPVLAFENSGVQEVVAPGETGWLVEDGDYGAMVDMVWRVAGMQVEWSAREAVKESAGCAAEYLALIEDRLRARSGKAAVVPPSDAGRSNEFFPIEPVAIELGEALDRLAESEAARSRLKSKLKATSRELEQIKRSRFWKATKPFRGAFRLLRRVGRA